MKRIRIDDSETESASDGEGGTASKCGNPLPIYAIVPSNDGNPDSLVRTFKRVRDENPNVMHSPDSTQDDHGNNTRRVIMIPPLPSTSGTGDNAEIEAVASSTSDDVGEHLASCPQARLCQIRDTLLTDDEIQAALTANYANALREEGLSVGKVMLQARSRSEQVLADGPVREYLDSQRRMILDNKNWKILGCNCYTRKLQLQEEIISSSVSQPSSSTPTLYGCSPESSTSSSSGFSNISSGDDFVSTTTGNSSLTATPDRKQSGPTSDSDDYDE